MGKRILRAIILDTNVITRYLIGDVESQLNEAKSLFLQAENKEVKLIILPVVVAEVSYILQTFYHKSEIEISTFLQAFLTCPWLEIEHKEALLGMWEWYEQGNHFVDSYLLALNKYENIGLFSFDKKINKLMENKVGDVR